MGQIFRPFFSLLMLFSEVIITCFQSMNFRNVEQNEKWQISMFKNGGAFLFVFKNLVVSFSHDGA